MENVRDEMLAYQTILRYAMDENKLIKSYSKMDTGFFQFKDFMMEVAMRGYACTLASFVKNLDNNERLSFIHDSFLKIQAEINLLIGKFKTDLSTETVENSVDK